ncbi:MAG: DUF2075 domain-containing protein [Caldilineaceae bacterium]
MRVFSGSLQQFQHQLQANSLFLDMQERFPHVVGRTPAPSEILSWRGSLPRLDYALRSAGVPDDVHVTIEERIPYFGKRMDACLFGHTKDGSPYSVIVELKGWGEAEATEDGNVRTVIGGSMQIEPHPSAQARGYHEHLEDFRRAYQGDRRIGLGSCAYCHNYPGIIPDEGLFHPQFDHLRTQTPTFGERDAGLLAGYLNARLIQGGGRQVLDEYDSRGLGPSKQLIDHAGDMIAHQDVFRLLDEQLAANNAILRAVRDAGRTKHKHVILVRGGPGTGKSVIALNALGEVLRKELKVFLVSGSSAFTHGMRRILGKRLDGLIKFTDAFWDVDPNSIDVLIVDEGHRIREKSVPKVLGHLRPTISQVEELIRAAKTTIFFVDENQIISPDEVGEPRLIRATAERMGVEYKEFALTSQFRCNGSDAYLAWLDDVFELSGGHKGLKLATPAGFDFKILDTPRDLLDEVWEKNAQQPNTARLLAGWCWPWSDPLPDSLVDDIQIGDFRFPWEAKNNKKPPPGIPEAKHWAIDPAGVNQAGTVYSVQGFETQHVGVILGPDLLRREGRWEAVPRNNFSNNLRSKPPHVVLPYLKRIYRTLLSRGMKSCSVYCVDEETRFFLDSHLLPV